MPVKAHCQVFWGDPESLTEEEPDACGGSPDYIVYLHCHHENTVAFKRDSYGTVCKRHAEMVKDKRGICGCSWRVYNIKIWPGDRPDSPERRAIDAWESGDS